MHVNSCETVSADKRTVENSTKVLFLLRLKRPVLPVVLKKAGH
ncbi:MAG: hypothetical protein AB9861_01725 [Methanosarcina sp.]